MFQIRANNIFITFELFFSYIHLSNFWSSLLAKIYCALPLKAHESLIILNIYMQQRNPRLERFILTLWVLGPWHIYYLRPKTFFFQEAFNFGLMIVTMLWSYEPFKLKYTLGFWNKPLICENFFSFRPTVLGHALTFRSFFQILCLSFVL